MFVSHRTIIIANEIRITLIDINSLQPFYYREKELARKNGSGKLMSSWLQKASKRKSDEQSAVQNINEEKKQKT